MSLALETTLHRLAERPSTGLGKLWTKPRASRIEPRPDGSAPCALPPALDAIRTLSGTWTAPATLRGLGGSRWVDLIVNCGTPLRVRATDEHVVPLGQAVVLGPTRQPLEVEFAGDVAVIVVTIRAGHAARLLQSPICELTDKLVPLEELWGRAGEELGVQLAEVAHEQRRAVLRDALAPRVAVGAETDSWVDIALAQIHAARGQVQVAQLAAALHRSERTLERVFTTHVGLSPKSYCRALRFRHALALLRAYPRVGGAVIAQECGYYDQAHLLREFRAFAGLTPQMYLQLSA